MLHFRTCVKTFLFSFIFLFPSLLWQLLYTFFFASSSPRSRCGICRSFYWSKKIYMHYVMRVTLSNYEFQFGSWFILSHFCFLNWFFLRYDFYLQLGLTSSRNKVISPQKGKKNVFNQKGYVLFILFVLVTNAARASVCLYIMCTDNGKRNLKTFCILLEKFCPILIHCIQLIYDFLPAICPNV